jgi:hypothetical protein
MGEKHFMSFSSLGFLGGCIPVPITSALSNRLTTFQPGTGLLLRANRKGSVSGDSSRWRSAGSSQGKPFSLMLSMGFGSYSYMPIPITQGQEKRYSLEKLGHLQHIYRESSPEV